MDNVTLPDGRQTTRLGFGGAALVAGRAMRESHDLIAAALDAGIRHFDLAPAYGLAEDVLGTFLKAHGSNGITITTKVGIARPRSAGAMSVARGLARRVFAAAPALRQRFGRAAYQANRRVQFALKDVHASLDESQRRLGVERIDVLLLHEATAADVSDELMVWLEDIRQQGRIGSFGVGGERHQTLTLLAERPALGDVVQTSWCLFDQGNSLPTRGLLVTHGALRALPRLIGMLRKDPPFAAALSEAAGVDVTSERMLADLMLGAALGNNPDGLVLVASRRPERIRRNATIVAAPELIAAGTHLNHALTALAKNV